MQYAIRFSLIILAVFLGEQGFAQQVCSGALGDPIAGAGTDFGNGQSTFGPSILTTTYRYVAKTPEDGEYTLAKTTKGLNGGWLQDIKNHTPNDPDGYMMVVNASYDKDIFYTANVTALCPGTTYEFGAFIINLLRRDDGIKPNITFAIYDANRNVLAKYTTGDIPAGSANDWKKYALIFTTPASNPIITIELSNENPGGGGNDLALDDITFRACGPTISTSGNDQKNTPINACIGQSKELTFNATVSDGYANPAYQWQINNGSGFVDLPGQNSTQFAYNTNLLPVGNYQFRIKVAEKVNIASPNCGVVGEAISVNIYKIPVANAPAINPVCVGQTLQLIASGGTSYYWVGPNGFKSTQQNPTITNVQRGMSGTYTVVATTNGCSSLPVNVTAVLYDAVVAKTKDASINICSGAPAQLLAIGSNAYSYTWFPADGLSDTNIANPIATPGKTTTYTVTVSNGVCTATDTTQVVVTEIPFISAGPDIKLFAGQAKPLAGKITGTEYRFFWTPTDYLDDPTSLSPVASPKTDITYTLHVVSTIGCFDIQSTVFVKVYPEIIIPNTFSPNGDGVNDTWNIPAAAAFDQTKIKIFNRYGDLVYQNYGIFEPWDGKYKGANLPVGVYYYTAYFNQDFKTFSGTITLIR